MGLSTSRLRAALQCRWLLGPVADPLFLVFHANRSRNELDTLDSQFFTWHYESSRKQKLKGSSLALRAPSLMSVTNFFELVNFSALLDADDDSPSTSGWRL